jgi:predicted transcriptional regulator
MDKLEFSRNKLKASKEHWAQICWLADVSMRTLYNIANESHSPNTSTVDKIYTAIKSIKVKK